MCLEEYEYRRHFADIPKEVFVHIDIPLTAEHQIELLKNAGFDTVEILYQNCSTAIIRADKR